MTKRLISLVVSIVFLTLASVSLNAQSIFGTITGTVQDSSGAVVPNASVTLKDVNSGTSRHAITNSDGYYSFSSVPVGRYTVLVDAQGFKKSQIEGIEVSGASSQAFVTKLSVGTENTSIEVIGIADTIIPIDSGEKSTTLAAKQLQDFTEVSRNAAEFIKIVPGFVPSNGLQSGANYNGEVIGINGNGDGGSQSPLNGAYVANGVGTTNTGANGSTQNIDITADGAHVSDPGCNCATPINPNGDMIQEFKVLTSNFSAENSHGPIVINTIAKSGGHDFHGEGYFYARDYALNANRWLNDRTNQPKPTNKFFFPGANIGGPVLIPHTDFNRNRDKLFFWTGFEYYYQNLDTGLLADTVPTAAMRGLDPNLNGAADYSPTELAKLGTVDSSGSAPVQLDPCLTGIGTGGLVAAGCPTSWWGGTVTTTAGSPAPFPGGIIPANFVSPSGQGLLNLFPLPNADPNANFGSNYLKQIVFDQNMWQWMSRVDYNISDNTKLYVRYNLQKELQSFPVGLWWRNANQIPYPTPILGKNRSDSVSASLTHVFNPSLSNEFVFGYTYIDFPNVFEDANKVSRTSLGIPFTGLFKNGIEQVPSLTSWSGGAAEFPTMLNPSGFQIGGSQGLFAVKKMPTVGDVLSKVWGTHTAKFGFYYEFVINDQPSNNYGNGLIAEYTNAQWNGGSASPFADLLGGFANQYQESNKDVLHNEAYNTVEFFAQDSWKLMRRLTVDYGLRFSHFGNWYDRQGVGFAVWNPAIYDATQGANSGTGFEWHANNKSVPLSGFNDRGMLYAPRFGLAYDVFGTGKTIVRGGWGRFYFHNAQFTQGLDTPLGVQTPSFNGMTLPQIEALTPGAAPFAAAGVLPTDDKTPLTTSYSFTVAQRLPFSSLLEASYVGTDSKYLLNGTGIGTNANVVPYGTLFNRGSDPAAFGSGEYQFAPYNIYQALNIAQHNLSSNYNSLQVSWVRQKGAFDIDVNYVYSKALGIFGVTNQLSQGHQNYGAMPFDRRHVFNAAYSVLLPSPIHDNKAFSGIVNGWQLSGITSFQSGVNLTANSNGTKGDFNVGGNICSNNCAGNPGTLYANDGFANSTINAQSINGTDQIPLMPIVTCDPRSGLGHNQYINGNCFALPTTPGTNGQLILPEVFGPWYWTSDLALFKNFQMGESKKLQFRVEAFNFMNHPEWSFSNSGLGSGALNLNWAPNGTGGANMTNTTFGTPQIKVGNRIVELAIKYYF